MDSAVIRPYARSPVPASRAPVAGSPCLHPRPGPHRHPQGVQARTPRLPLSCPTVRKNGGCEPTIRLAPGKLVIPMLSTILVPLDGSPLAEHALPHAKRLAEAASARLVLTRVLPLPVFQSAENDLAS